MFRILQETLTNVTRHAGATSVEIRLEESDGLLKLEVRDNGCGISADKMNAGQSMGLVGMRERALLSQGKLDIKGVKGQGTVVTLTMPRWKKAVRPSSAGTGKGKLKS